MMTLNSLTCRGLKDDLESILEPDAQKRLVRTVLSKGTKVYSNVRLATKQIGGSQYVIAAEGESKDVELEVQDVEIPFGDSTDVIFQLFHGLRITFGEGDLTLHFSGESAGEFVKAMGNFIASLLKVQPGMQNFPLQLTADEKRSDY